MDEGETGLRDCKDCGDDISNRKPQTSYCHACREERRKAQRREYNSRPYVKAKYKAREQTPERKAFRRGYYRWWWREQAWDNSPAHQRLLERQRRKRDMYGEKYNDLVA